MQTIADAMTREARTLDESATLVDAATMMREHDMGDVIVTKDGRPTGIATDRDIVIRAIADGRDPSTTPLGEIASGELVTVSPGDDIDTAVALMRDKALRRLPVVEDGRAIGFISLGDLAEEQDPRSALADISTAPPNQ